MVANADAEALETVVIHEAEEIHAVKEAHEVAAVRGGQVTREGQVAQEALDVLDALDVPEGRADDRNEEPLKRFLVQLRSSAIHHSLIFHRSS